MIKRYSRQWFLGILSLSTGLTLIQVWLRPVMPDPRNAPIHLPAKIDLAGWQLQTSQPLEPLSTHSKYNHILGGYRYLYQRDDRTITMTLRDMMATEGDIGQFEADDPARLGQPSTSMSDRQFQNGFYRLSTTSTLAYLQSCLPPQGDATVTPKQFRQNAYRQALQPQQWLGWMMGQRPLLAHRCLWFELSTPIRDHDIFTAYTLLEQTWQTLLPSWRSR